MKANIDGINAEMTVDEFIDFLEKTECDCDKCSCESHGFNKLTAFDTIVINGVPFKIYLNYDKTID